MSEVYGEGNTCIPLFMLCKLFHFAINRVSVDIIIKVKVMEHVWGRGSVSV